MRDAEAWLLGYLLNSAWQVPLVFATAWVAARLSRRSGPAVEHRIYVSAMVVEVMLPACSASPMEMLHWVREFVMSIAGENAAMGIGRVSTLVGPGVAHGGLLLPSTLMSVVAVMYGLTIVHFAGRLCLGLWRTSLLQRRAEAVELNGAAAQSWQRCSEMFDVTDAEVAVTDELSGPVTTGVFRRTLLFPAGALAAWSDEDIEAAIAHEFAHMQRRDFAKNILLEVMSLPVAWHPVMWVTRERVAESRELVCDAMAADAVAGRQKYARSLLRLASMVSEQTQARTLHAIGIFDANNFERRVMNLTQGSVEIRGVRRVVTVAACVMFGVGTCASALAVRMNVAVPSNMRSAPPLEARKEAMKVDAGVMTGNILTKVTPVYPPKAKAAKIQGAVVMEAVIDKVGNIDKLKILSGPDELRRSAWGAVKQWKYKPYLLNGEPTEVETTITVTFSLAN
jgi:TonB family protein